MDQLKNKEALSIFKQSVCDFNPKLFKPYILSDAIQFDGDKKQFYKLFKRMVCTAKANSVGELSLKIEPTDHPQKKYYCFYDQKHVHARITFTVEEKEDAICLDILPF